MSTPQPLMAEAIPDAPSPAPLSPSSLVTLEDWARSTSGHVADVELLAAFHHIEHGAGRLKDTAANFATRWVAVGGRTTS